MNCDHRLWSHSLGSRQLHYTNDRAMAGVTSRYSCNPRYLLLLSRNPRCVNSHSIFSQHNISRETGTINLGRTETHNLSTIHISAFTSCSQAIFSFFQSYSQVSCLVKKHVRSLACSFSAPTFKEACHGLQRVRIDLLRRQCLPTEVPSEINQLLVSSYVHIALGLFSLSSPLEAPQPPLRAAQNFLDPVPLAAGVCAG
jgi:hypothetical protein